MNGISYATRDFLLANLYQLYPKRIVSIIHSQEESLRVGHNAPPIINGDLIIVHQAVSDEHLESIKESFVEIDIRAILDGDIMQINADFIFVSPRAAMYYTYNDRSSFDPKIRGHTARKVGSMKTNSKCEVFMIY